MIFTALGLLVVAAGLLLAGIAKSSVALLMASLLLTIASAVVLAMVLPAARKLAESNGSTNAQIVGPNGVAQPVVLYVQQAPPVGDTNGHSPIVGYDEMTATQITKLIASGALTDDQLDAVRDYEATHAARRSVLAKLS